MRVSVIALVASLVALPFAAAPAAFAQDNPSAKDLKGPPNANGYGKEKMGKTTTDEKEASGKDLKGPPNANGYEKK